MQELTLKKKVIIFSCGHVVCCFGGEHTHTHTDQNVF
jgi:hypothetical protein